MSPILTQKPSNIIYSGVAGTGKTHRLLQIAKEYSNNLPTIDKKTLLAQLVDHLSWREVVCLILLERQSAHKDLIKVPEIVAHEFFIAKAAQNERSKNLSNTVWSVLQTHSLATSQTVNCEQRASQAYFDKNESGAWYLLTDSMVLLDDLVQKLSDFQQMLHGNFAQQSLRNERYSMVSFHQAYGYEEFVEGIRPVLGQSAQISYEVQEGAFLQLCRRASQDPEQRYAMLIDEINRANVTRVFGELLSLIEDDKRAGSANAMQVKLAYSGRAFSVPANVDIYATMNTQDHSLAPLDMALRRRFRFIDCAPQPALLQTITLNSIDDEMSTDSQMTTTPLVETIDLAQLLTGLNKRIVQMLGQEAQLGHAFLMAITDLAQLRAALLEQIIPQLAQAVSGRLDLLQYLFNDELQPYEAQFIQDLHFANKNFGSDRESAFYAKSANHSVFGAQNTTAGGYKINADLLAGKGHFTKAVTYQRLY